MWWTPNRIEQHAIIWLNMTSEFTWVYCCTFALLALVQAHLNFSILNFATSCPFNADFFPLLSSVYTSCASVYLNMNLWTLTHTVNLFLQSAAQNSISLRGRNGWLIADYYPQFAGTFTAPEGKQKIMPSSTPSSEALEYSFEKLFPHFFISCHSSHKDQLQVSGFFALILLQSLLSLASELSLVSLSTAPQVSAKHAISCPSLLVHHFSHNFKLPVPMNKATMRNCKKSFTQLTYEIPERGIPGRNEIPKKYGCQFPQHTQWRKHNLRCMYFF